MRVLVGQALFEVIGDLIGRLFVERAKYEALQLLAVGMHHGVSCTGRVNGGAGELLYL